MLGRFGRDAGSLLGVEIASDSVRILQLHRRRGRRVVAAWALEPFDTPWRGDASQDPQPVVDALRRARLRSGSRQCRAAIALPGSEVICKVCHLSATLSAGEMEAQLLTDADRLFPFPLQDLALDFQILGPASGQPGHVDVLVGACRQGLLEPLEQLLEDAGLHAEAAEVDSIALGRLLPSASSASTGLLRLEADSATLHAWPQGGLPQRLALRFARSDSWERRLEGIGQLLHHNLPTIGVEHLWIAASAPADEGWAEALKVRLGIPCEPLVPCIDLAAGTDEAATQALLRDFSPMALACGLALGGAH
ncbi:pilus assembly protein PilM [Pseudomonas guariconensis]|uniref:type IV pilus biogenesis protein PilM n=1 Tax=Pseudomonas TaxID=286 RepID=UPI001CE427B6|nr:MULTISPECIES: pilus assembly protein PilM [Pseudomonas]MCO7636040.1 pilus assembly protein PilM [Pseudomonas sp. S 311-6]MCO7513223.1 pilus assembly protein PilM [Pseudomonas putida]MCO7563384.1 pilus assembly protein PilM [Pseudomonas mosselii]MCO7594703.1 pilus assembly protein PilM [Pseudomonas guariconensis]MCO7603677.1 pilus assembly protein PilM [Pseudomonas guariconensis]